jgi:hypothetical protein
MRFGSGHHHAFPHPTHFQMRSLLLVLFTTTASTALAQAPAVPPADVQIAAAVLPLPEAMRATARVLGYGPDGKLGVLREGKVMVCLAHNPSSPTFHVACYHELMEPFMARGRELRTQGTVGPQVDSVRYREARSGQLKLPNGPTTLYSLTGGTFEAQANTAPGAKHLYVVYIPYATSESTGLPTRPRGSEPWLMSQGTPKAHIMFTPSM